MSSEAVYLGGADEVDGSPGGREWVSTGQNLQGGGGEKGSV